MGCKLKKKKEEYIKLVVRKQNHSERFVSGFMIEVLYQGLSFHLEIVILKIKVWLFMQEEEKNTKNIYIIELIESS